jgi:hypothetical protein
MLTMDTLVGKLAQLMTANRHRHEKAWEKVRVDRLHKLFPELEEAADILALVQAAVKAGVVRECHKQCDDGLIPAVRLNTFTFDRSLRFR